MSNMQKIKAFWESTALDADTDMGGTLRDENLRRLEIDAIAGRLRSGAKVLDIGCGNGFSTISFAERLAIEIRGIDYSKEMIKNARCLLEKRRHRLQGNVDFMAADVLKREALGEGYDIVVTERCLINLRTWENQKRAIEHIHSILDVGGLFLMLEGFLDNLELLNEVRSRFDLDPIEVVWHNEFFGKQQFEKFVQSYFTIEEVDPFGSTYMLITRSLLHAIQKHSSDYNNEWDYLATLLPDFGSFNYQQLYVLRKREGPSA